MSKKLVLRTKGYKIKNVIILEIIFCKIKHRGFILIVDYKRKREHNCLGIVSFLGYSEIIGI